MRKIDTAAITNTVAMPVKAGTLDHLQLAYGEAINAVAMAIINGANYSPAAVYILFGCGNSGSGNNYVIAAGAVLLGGEVYSVDAVSFTTAAGQVAVGTTVISYHVTNADPVMFTDGQQRNVHQIRKVVIGAGVSGSGVADYGSFRPVNFKNFNYASSTARSSVLFNGSNVPAMVNLGGPVVCLTIQDAAGDNNLTLDFTGAMVGAEAVALMQRTTAAAFTFHKAGTGNAVKIIAEDSSNGATKLLIQARLLHFDGTTYTALVRITAGADTPLL